MQRLEMKILILTIFLFTSISAQITNVNLISKSIKLYEKAEWDISLIGNWSDPFLQSEISVDMIIISPSGRNLLLPCFYVSGESGKISNWKAIFTPQEIGSYKYHFALTQNGKIISNSVLSSFSSQSSNKKGILHINDYWTFKYDNGDAFRGIGENIGWEKRDTDDSKFFKLLHEEPRFNYSYMLKSLANNGGNFFRTWMIYWNLPVDWKNVKNAGRYENADSHFNPSGIERMDYLVQLCDSLDLHFMLTLSGAGSFSKNGWELSSYNQINGGFAQTPQEFFELEDSRIQYKNFLRYIVARWGYSPSIGAWEFFNEIDNAVYQNSNGDYIPHNLITEWHNEMTTYLKSIDPYKHIVTTSISHRDIDGLNSVENIDLNQKHIYKQTTQIPNTIKEYTEKYKKPYAIGEFGFEWDWQLNFNDFAEEMDSDFKRGLWYGLFSPTPIMPMSWWWEFFDERNIKYYFGRVSEISRNMLKAGNGSFEKMKATSNDSDLHVYSVLCGAKQFIYVFNPNDEDKNVELTVDQNSNEVKNIEYYDCDTGVYHSLDKYTLSASKITLNNYILEGKTDFILIVHY